MTRGRKLRECGAIGVNKVQGTLGAAIGPPAAMLYAVLPDGVAIIRPSACSESLESFLVNCGNACELHHVQSLNKGPVRS